MIPAMKSWPIEVLVATPYTIITMDGGITVPSEPAHPRSAQE